MTSYIGVFKVQLVREGSFPYADRQIRSADDAADILAGYLVGVDREHFVVLTLDTKHKVTGIHTVSVGSLDATIVHPREVYKPAVLAGASGIIVGHNHPSGDPTPSSEDIAVTKRLKEAGTLLGIDFLDHIIVGDNGRYTSLKSEGKC